MLSTLFLAAVATSVDPAEVRSDDWLRFRGNQGDSRLDERRYPAEWGPDTNLAWSAPLPGSGWASPIVVGERVFVSSAVGEGDIAPRDFSGGVRDPSTRGRAVRPDGELTFLLTCLSLEDGHEVWTREVGARVPEHGVHRSNTFATESPCSDGARVFVTYGALGALVAYDLEGELLWRAETGVHPTGNNFGWGISPIHADGLVLLQNDNEAGSFLEAFDAETGERAWRVERGTGTSWGTPVVWERDGMRQVVACGPDAVVGYALADGSETWRVQGFGGSFSSSPTVVDQQLVFGNSGPMSRGPLLAVPHGLEGTIDVKGEGREAVAWRTDRAGPGFASPVSKDGFVYVLGSSTILACHDLATGERLWRERLPDAAQVVASPWIAGDELHVLDEAGTTFVVPVGPEFEVTRTNRIEGLYWSTPAVAGDSLLLRAADRLHCVRSSVPEPDETSDGEEAAEGPDRSDP